MDLGPLISLLRTHISHITRHGARSIALPLLGTGYQGLDIKDVTFEILRLIRAWSNSAPELRVARVARQRLNEELSRQREELKAVNVRVRNAKSQLVRAKNIDLDSSHGIDAG